MSGLCEQPTTKPASYAASMASYAQWLLATSTKVLLLPLWFRLSARRRIAALCSGVYLWLRDDKLDRAALAGYESIMITVDTAVLGRRERDVRRGFTLPPKLGLDTIVDGALHPGWTWDFVRADPIRFANVVGAASDDGASPVVITSERRIDEVVGRLVAPGDLVEGVRPAR